MLTKSLAQKQRVAWWLLGWEWGRWEILVRGYELSVIRGNSGELMYSMVFIVNTSLYLKFAERVDLKCSHHTEKMVLCEVMC